MTAEAAATVTDADRLAKLWDAYKAQEEELQQAHERLARFTAEMEGRDAAFLERERALQEKDRDIQDLRDLLAQKDARIAELESLEQDVKAVEAYQQRIAELEAAYTQEKERLAKLFLLYEEATKGGGGA